MRSTCSKTEYYQSETKQIWFSILFFKYEKHNEIRMDTCVYIILKSIFAIFPINMQKISIHVN